MVGRGGKDEKKEEEVRSGRVIEKKVKEGGGKGKGGRGKAAVGLLPLPKILECTETS